MKLKSIEEIDKDIKVISNSLEKETCALQSLEQQILEIRGPKSSSNESEDLGNGVWNEVKGLMFKKRKQLENVCDACISFIFRRKSMHVERKFVIYLDVWMRLSVSAMLQRFQRNTFVIHINNYILEY